MQRKPTHRGKQNRKGPPQLWYRLDPQTAEELRIITDRANDIYRAIGSTWRETEGGILATIIHHTEMNFRYVEIERKYRSQHPMARRTAPILNMDGTPHEPEIERNG